MSSTLDIKSAFAGEAVGSIGYKDISSAIDGGSRVVAREQKNWSSGGWKDKYSVVVDGKRYDVSSASWNKLNKEYDLRVADVDEVNKTRFIYSEVEGRRKRNAIIA